MKCGPDIAVPLNIIVITMSSAHKITGRVGQSVECVQLDATPRSLACPRSLVLQLYIWVGASGSAACRRNISPVKSPARPLRRTARLACASRRAPTETRALLAQSNTEYSSRIFGFSVAQCRLHRFPLLEPFYIRNIALKLYLTFETAVLIVCVCVRSACTRLALIIPAPVVLGKSKDTVIIRLPANTVSIASTA